MIAPVWAELGEDLALELLEEARIPIVGYVRHQRGRGAVRVRPHRRELTLRAGTATRVRDKTRVRPGTKWPRAAWTAMLHKHGVKVLSLPPSRPGSEAAAELERIYDAAGTVYAQALQRFPALAGKGDQRLRQFGLPTSPELDAETRTDMQIALGMGGMGITWNAGTEAEAKALWVNPFGPSQRELQTKFSTFVVPSNLVEGEGTAWHEVGHLLAFTAGAPTGTAVRHETPELAEAKERAWYKTQFSYAGLDYNELLKLSPYAASSPAEAAAELASMIFTPGFAHLLPPRLAGRARTMFESWGRGEALKQPLGGRMASLYEASMRDRGG